MINWSADTTSGKRTRLVRRSFECMLAEERERQKIREETEFWRGRWSLVVREIEQAYKEKIKAEHQRIISTVRAEQKCLVRALKEGKDWEVEEKMEQEKWMSEGVACAPLMITEVARLPCYLEWWSIKC